MGLYNILLFIFNPKKTHSCDLFVEPDPVFS